jgi:hypothetical protein
VFESGALVDTHLVDTLVEFTGDLDQDFHQVRAAAFANLS